MLGMDAVSEACRQLNERLAPYRKKLPGATFREAINAAYLDRVDLSAHGFYTTPDVTGVTSKPPLCMHGGMAMHVPVSYHASGLILP